MMRLLDLVTGEYAQIGLINSTVSITVDESRGYIYDRGMKPLVNEEKELTAVVSPTVDAVAALRELVSEDEFSTVRERLEKGFPAVTKVSNTTDCKDIKVIKSFKRYSDSQMLSHIIGYLDGTGGAVCGIEKGFDGILGDEGRRCSVRFSVDAGGRVLGGEKAAMNYGRYYSPAGVCLTVDKNIQKTVEEVIAAHGFESGAAVISDIKSGELLALVSVPDFDVNDVSASLDSDKAPFLNRALNAYSVGSVYKMIVACAALESGIPGSFEYNCTGSTEKSGVVFNCHRRSGHGVLDMGGAVSNSCNTYFIELASKTGAHNIIELSYYMGLGTQLELAPGVIAASGILPDEETLDSDASLANLAFGQGKLLATPVQINAVTACIACGGIYHEPYLIKAMVNDDGELYNRHEKPFDQRVISERTANTVKKYLIKTAEESKVKAPKNIAVGGKTATSQSGVYENGTELLNTWYSGFFPADSPKYAVTVLCENGESGAYDCQPVFNDIAERLTMETLTMYKKTPDRSFDLSGAGNTDVNHESKS